MMEALRRNGSWSGEVHSLRRDGTTFWCQARVSTFDHPDYGPVWIAVHSDISERKRAEAERDRFAAAQALFIAAAAHELRTPVTTLVGMASTLQQHRHSMSADELDFAFGALGRQGERMSGLIGHLLDLARIDNSGDLASMKVVALDDVLREALETAPPPPGVRVRARIVPDLRVRAEPVGLGQVVVNLLTNAYRYGGPLIDVEAVAHQDGVMITVTDDGSGVAPDLLDRLFQPFTRGIGGAVRGGSGLGLTVAERTVEAFGGSIRYEPGRPSGSRFVIELPAPE
jgi:two-component system sensor histidine kinase KdpD